MTRELALAPRPKDRPAFSTAAILCDGTLPAEYLNAFGDGSPVAELKMSGKYGLEVGNKQLELNQPQVLALNALAINMGSNPAFARQITAMTRETELKTSALTLSRSLIPLSNFINEAADAPVLVVGNQTTSEQRGMTYWLAVTRFVQKAPYGNEYFRRLTPRGIDKFGRHVLRYVAPLGKPQAVNTNEQLSAALGEDAELSEPWQFYANCREEDPDVFFGSSRQQIARAQAICQGCFVRAECLESGQDSNEHGIWGGNTEKERRRKQKSLRFSEYSDIL